jgi:hypothetical protein
MANIVKNHLRVTGLRENPEKLAKALELEMYGTVVPHEPGNPFVKAGNGGFDFTTEWQPDINALFELSKKYEDHTFLLVMHARIRITHATARSSLVTGMWRSR